MAYFHLVARARYGLKPLIDREVCADLWQRLRLRMGPVLACVFMPNHLHLDLESPDPDHCRSELSVELAAFVKHRFPGNRIWDPVSDVQLLSDRLHLKRHIRYVHLNPCRWGLARDPLEWEWSTHRDAVNAVTSPWAQIPRWEGLWGCRRGELPKVLHAYVSGDPTVAVKGTSLPGQILPGQFVATLTQIGEAVLQVTRAPSRTLCGHGAPARKLALRVASLLGGRNQVQLAEWLRVTPKTVRNVLCTDPSPAEIAEIQTVIWVLGNRSRFTRPPFQKAEI